LFNELKRRNVFRVAIAYIVVAWFVLQVADVVLNNITAPGWVFKVLMLFVAIGFPFAVIFAWAFEMTPEGLKRESEVDRSQSITTQTGKKLNMVIFAVMALAIVYFAYDKFVLTAGRDAALVEATTQVIGEQAVPEEAPAESDNSIAVLPFVNMSSDEEQEYFSDGLSEELLNLLAKIPELRVAARTSSFSFKGQNIEIPDIADRLKVAHILEGSVRKSGNQVRITAQLIKADDGFHLWSETYDRSLDNIFVIQDEIASEVVAQLKLTMLGSVPTIEETDPEAFAQFLRARHLSRLGTMEGRSESSAILKQILITNPDYSTAWALLGLNYMNDSAMGTRDPEEGWTLSEEALNKALATDPNNAQALSRLANLGIFQTGEMAPAARLHERALAIEPSNVVVLGNAAIFLTRLGRLEEAIAVNEYMLKLDPVNATGMVNLGGLYLYVGRTDEAFDLLQTLLKTNPGRPGGRYFLGVTQLLRGNTEAALASFVDETDEEYRLHGKSLALYALGRQAEFNSTFMKLQEKWGDRWPVDVASVYAFSGDADAAFLWLEKELQVNGLSGQTTNNPFLSSLRNDPRWLPMLEKAGASTAQLDAIEFKLKLPE
jgi:TolB-like protein/tetratricopeptide (TPR) repeat protein